MTRKARTATTTEAELRAFSDAGLTWIQVAERIGIDVNIIRQTASVLGIKSAYLSGAYIRNTKFSADDAFRLLVAGGTLQEVADKFGVTRTAVRSKLKRRGLPTNCRAAVEYQAQQAAK